MPVRWFSPGIPVSSTNKTDRHNITEILLKVALNTINLNQQIQDSDLLRTGFNIYFEFVFSEDDSGLITIGYLFPFIKQI